MKEDKEKAIQHSWELLVGADSFDKLKLDEDGYSDWRCRMLMPTAYFVQLSDKLKQGRTKMSNGSDLLCRPKTLKGIENNNGWVKIYTPSDLPKIGNTYMFLVDGREVTQWCEDGMRFDKRFTHWRVIEPKPKPLY